MRSLIVVALFLSVFFSGAQVLAGIDDWRFKYWKIKASNCGGWYQLFVHAELGHLLPDHKTSTLANAKEKGASTKQIYILSREFEKGREKIVQGIGDERGLKKDEIDSNDMKELGKSARKIGIECTTQDVTLYEFFLFGE